MHCPLISELIYNATMIRLLLIDVALVALAVVGGTQGTTTKQTIVTGNANITVHLQENATNGLKIIQLQATSATSYTLSQQPTSGMFDIVSGDGTLSLKDSSKLDYEATTSYNLTVTANNTAGQAVVSHLTLFVDDANDNSPKFEKKKYGTTIANNTAKGTTLIQVQATDLDKSDDFKTLQYSISNGDKNLFEITPNNGTIKAKKIITVAKVTTYNLTVQAEDNQHGRTKHQGTAAVSICVGCTADHGTDNGTARAGAAISLVLITIFASFIF